MLHVNQFVFVAALATLVGAAACSGKEEKKSGEPAASNPSEAAATEGKGEPKGTPAGAVEAAKSVGVNFDDAEAMGREACKVLSKEEASEILGKPANDPKPGIYNCMWQAGQEMRMLLVELRAPSAYDMARQMEEEAEELTGIGEKAFYGSTAGSHVVFVKGGKYVHIALMGDKPDAGKQTVIDWAKKLAARM